jgi:hypothetical protein
MDYHFTKLVEDIKVGMKCWLPVIEYMNYYKDDINESYNVNAIILQSITHYLNVLVNLNYNVCYLETTKIFIKWLGLPYYYTEDNINYTILMCMNTLGIKCNQYDQCYNKMCSN